MMVRGGIDGHGITYCFASHWRFGGVWGERGGLVHTVYTFSISISLCSRYSYK